MNVRIVSYETGVGDEELLARANDVERVPRVGDTVALTGAQFAKIDGEPGEAFFDVVDVVWRYDVARSCAARDDEDVTIVVRRSEFDDDSDSPRLQLSCVCDEGERVLRGLGGNECDNCGRKIPRKKRS